MTDHNAVMTATMGQATKACRSAGYRPDELLTRVLEGEREAQDLLHALIGVDVEGD